MGLAFTASAISIIPRPLSLHQCRVLSFFCCIMDQPSTSCLSSPVPSSPHSQPFPKMLVSSSCIWLWLCCHLLSHEYISPGKPSKFDHAYISTMTCFQTRWHTITEIFAFKLPLFMPLPLLQVSLTLPTITVRFVTCKKSQNPLCYKVQQKNSFS